MKRLPMPGCARSTLAGTALTALLTLTSLPGIAWSQAAAPAAAAPAAPAAPAALVGDAKRGQLKSATCVGCHNIPGYKADFPLVYRVPMLGGQNAQYLEAALRAYQKGERRFPSMIATARSLSDQDIADVAAFYAAQR